MNDPLFLYLNLFCNIFFQISGPLLHIPLEYHSMVKLGKGQAIIGGRSNGVYQTRIYSLDCLNRNCIISLLNKELQAPRDKFVAIPIPDKMSGCITGGNYNFKKKIKSSILPNICFFLNYSLPVPTTDWGWPLS